MNQYVVIKYLGRGACGRVFLCMDMYDNRLYAVKVWPSAYLDLAQSVTLIPTLPQKLATLP